MLSGAIGELREVSNAQREDAIRFLFGKIILVQCGGSLTGRETGGGDTRGAAVPEGSWERSSACAAPSRHLHSLLLTLWFSSASFKPSSPKSCFLSKAFPRFSTPQGSPFPCALQQPPRSVETALLSPLRLAELWALDWRQAPRGAGPRGEGGGGGKL